MHRALQVVLVAVYFLAALALLQRATSSGGTGVSSSGDVDGGSGNGNDGNSGSDMTGTIPQQQQRQPRRELSRQPGGGGLQEVSDPAAAALPWTTLERMFLWGLVPLELYCAFGHRVLCVAVFGSHRLPFLPLLLTSVYCAVGAVAAWVKMTARHVRQLRGSNGSDDGAHRHAE